MISLIFMDFDDFQLGRGDGLRFSAISVILRSRGRFFVDFGDFRGQRSIFWGQLDFSAPGRDFSGSG